MPSTATSRPNPMANLSIVHGWFDEVGLSPDRYPADDVCYSLARELQIAVSRANNAQLERLAGHELPIGDLADVSPAEVISKKWLALRAAANHLAFALSHYEEFVPRHEWDANSGFNEIDDGLALMAAHPEELIPPLASPRGRRNEAWHPVGHAIAPPIQNALRSIGHNGRMAKTDQEGATAIIGAAAVSWAYGIELQAEGFASAMRRRNRRKLSPNSPGFGLLRDNLP